MWTARAVTIGAIMIETTPQNRMTIAQGRVPQDEVDPLADLGEERLARPIDRGTQVAADEEQPQARQRERERIDGERRSGPDGRGKEARDGRAEDEADRVDRLEERVGPSDLGAARRARVLTRYSRPGRTSGGCSSARPR